MIVVADASPLHYLVLIEQIAVLSLLYGQVLVPSVVCEELQRPQTRRPGEAGPRSSLGMVGLSVAFDLSM